MANKQAHGEANARNDGNAVDQPPIDACWERREASPEPAVETALKAIDADARHDRFELFDDGAKVRRSWRLKAAEEGQLKRLAEQLCAIPGVVAYRLDPCDD